MPPKKRKATATRRKTFDHERHAAALREHSGRYAFTRCYVYFTDPEKKRVKMNAVEVSAEGITGTDMKYRKVFYPLDEVRKVIST